jgi:GDP-4-dehydro-6-deoxy-D-mannose reductase
VRALITGVGGFAGRHLAAYLLAQPDIEVFGSVMVAAAPRDGPPGVRLLPADLRDAAAATALIAEVQPDRVYHLAAQAYVPQSLRDPWGTLENNIRSQLNLLEAAVRLAPTTRILIVGSNEEYGHAPADELPLREDSPLRPNTPYAVSKIAQDFLGLQYALGAKLHVVRVRPFNHIGPGQNERFVAPQFARQIAEIEAGMRPEPALYVGNLDAQRDFSDVRDVVRAYYVVLQHGAPGEVYNICSGRPRSAGELLNLMLSMSRVPIEVKFDPSRMRAVDTPISYGDPSRLRAATGWQPEIPFEQTVQDVLDDWRSRVMRDA